MMDFPSIQVHPPGVRGVVIRTTLRQRVRERERVEIRGGTEVE